MIVTRLKIDLQPCRPGGVARCPFCDDRQKKVDLPLEGFRQKGGLPRHGKIGIGGDAWLGLDGGREQPEWTALLEADTGRSGAPLGLA